MEYDYYPEEEQVQKGITVKKILKYIVLAIVISVYALIIFRIIIKEDPKDAKKFIWTEQAVASYEADSSSFKVMNQQIRSFSYVNENDESVKVTYNTITDDGYFQVNNFMYIESTKQLIVTFRYNNASLKALQENYALSELPDGEPYFLALETSDGYITEYTYDTTSRFTYEYRRVVFDNVDLSKESTVEINIYYMQDVVLEEPLATLPVYDSRIPVEYYNISKVLPAKVNDGLQKSPYVITEE